MLLKLWLYNRCMSRLHNIVRKQSLRQELLHWSGGIRLYIAIGVGLLTLQIWWWARVAYGSGELLTSRLHEAYGWTALLLLAAALLIGPLYKLAPWLGGASLLRDARRLIGVGAAWFASLHAGIAYFASFKAINPLDLTVAYQRGFLLGGIAMICLFALAFTSFDAAFRTMGIWWFRLHRAIYVAATLAVWHALAIGVHAPGMPAVAILIIFGTSLFIMHMQAALQQEKAVSGWQIATLCIMGVVIIALSNYGIQLYIAQNNLQGHNH